MSPIDVISLQNARDWLVVDDNFDDTIITRLINSAVSWVEQYTCYRLYARDETFITTSCKTSLPYFPINSKSIKLKDDTDYTATNNTYFYAALSLIVDCPIQSTIMLNTGYTDPTQIPSPLLEACYKLITYLYENRDAYGTQLPIDIQILINQFRRSIV
jgi:hypothetical protein